MYGVGISSAAGPRAVLGVGVGGAPSAASAAPAVDALQQLLKQALTPDDGMRARVLQQLVSFIKTKSLEQLDSIRSCEDKIVPVHKLTPATRKRPLLLVHLPVIMRLAVEAPYQDIRESCTAILDFARDELDLPLPAPRESVSRYIPHSEVIPIDARGDVAQSIFEKTFNETGLVSHFERVMAYLPPIYEAFNATFSYVMRGPGPLPVTWRHYIAVLASARHRCEYFVRRQEAEFLAAGGDALWLQGADQAPRKIQNILELNMLMAHQPWRMNKQHVEALVRGADAWSIAELMHAIVLMSTFHSLCGFVHGSGLLPEADLCAADEEDPNEPSSPTHGGGGSGGEGSPRPAGSSPRHRSAPATPATPATPLAGAAAPADGGGEEVDTAEAIRLLKLGKDAWTRSSDDKITLLEKASRVGGAGTSTPPSEPPSSDRPHFDCSRYIGPYRMQHSDFNVRSNEYKGLRSTELCWAAHGYAMVNRFYPGVAPLLDREFKVTLESTDNSFACAPDVDTRPFRSAVWYYVHLIMGHSNDDFDYHQVNVILNRALKRYVKKAVTLPENLSRHDFVNFGYEMPAKEKVHVILLAAQARREAALLHALHAVNSRMTS
eukprot:tig00000197_g15683.t1